ncbi:hypothetical protein EV659_101328 [Rhodothalassium salexigens DSM 2132]|uniref:Uncharacterized protein n=1 Tax=Rhodothalassium salexigens DSM 2132 TaxID=1188247 RepID=A0A4R2PTG7_RHOSA|nr:hypothetical protein [Rhodothalassium salexigens DSM 2132]TCP38424.1 hypothetical protein EV659_101328 [Rhodothalassium salexigens DSM 2132]
MAKKQAGKPEEKKQAQQAQPRRQAGSEKEVKKQAKQR